MYKEIEEIQKGKYEIRIDFDKSAEVNTYRARVKSITAQPVSKSGAFDPYLIVEQGADKDLLIKKVQKMVEDL